MKRILALFLAILTCVSLSACSHSQKDEKKKKENSNENNASETVTAETEEENDPARILDLEKKDLGGYSFRFMTRRSSYYHLDSHEVWAEKLKGDAINDAVYRRNQLIEREYNCSIEEVKEYSPSGVARDSLLAGDYVADFLYDEARQLRTLVSLGLLKDTKGSEYINSEKAWYDTGLMDQVNVGDFRYFLAGDASILDDTSLYLIRVNYDILKQVEPSIDLYEEVRQGNWTVDRMYELALAASKDVNGNGKMELGTDRVGYLASKKAAWAHVAAGGVTVSNRYATGRIEIPPEPKSELQNAWGKIRGLLEAPFRAFDDKRIEYYDVAFSCERVSHLLGADAVPKQLGVLPMPKLSVEQIAYVTTAAFEDLCVYAIPRSVDHIQRAKELGFSSGTEMAAYFFEVFSYYSMKKLTPAFYEKLYESQCLKSDEEKEMLLYATFNRNYDPVVGYNFGAIDVFEVMDKKGTRNQLESLYRRYQPSAEQALSRYQEYMETANQGG
ncbi:MAG: hypothetical protein IKJ74_06580 [Clostridia bacterium]|nr:hypothetical protein [Clostridia bacterium]